MSRRHTNEVISFSTDEKSRTFSVSPGIYTITLPMVQKRLPLWRRVIRFLVHR